MPGSVKDLKVWQEAVLLCSDVVRAVHKGARRETRVFTDALLETACAVATHISQGSSHYQAAEQRRIYVQARRALMDLETLLTIARHSGVISPAVLTQLSGRIASVSRLLVGYLGYLERHIDELGSSTPVGAARPGAADSIRLKIEQVQEVPAASGR